MIDLLLYLSSATSPLLPPAPLAPAAIVQDDDPVEEFERRYEAAKGDEDELWTLYDWTVTFGLESKGKKVLRALIKIDEDNTRARELLGHVKYDGKWYTSQAKADSAREKAEAKAAKAKGWVKHEGQWVDPADIPFLEQGLVRDASGRWVDPEEQRKLDEGWVRQDLTWVSPDEIEKMNSGLWKVGDKWLDTAAANKHHSKLFQWWQIPSDRYELWTTCDRELADNVRREIDRTHADLERFFGKKPAGPPKVVILRSTEQYNDLAAGSSDDQRPATEANGWSSIHGAYFADAFYTGEFDFVGAGVGYWDNSTEDLDAFGVHYVRHAAGLAFVEGIDPSPKFLAKVKKSPRTLEKGFDDFYDEKQLPMVLRYGAAAFVERYFVDTRAASRGGDANWASKWSVQNIARTGGLDPIDRILEFRISADDLDASTKLINQAGLLVCFIMRGNNEAVTEAHRAWVEAFAKGDKLKKPTENLFDALRAEEAALRQFADQLGS